MRPLLSLPAPCVTRTRPFAPAAICRAEAPLTRRLASTFVGGASLGSNASPALRPERVFLAVPHAGLERQAAAVYAQRAFDVAQDFRVQPDFGRAEMHSGVGKLQLLE